MIFGFWIWVKKFQKSRFLTIQILDFDLFEDIKMSKLFF